MRFITDYLRLHHKLVRRQYPLPSIVETMQQLEGLQYATALYLNMGYSTIRISPDSQDMTNIVTEFGIFRYNLLLLGVLSLGYILQTKVDKLPCDIRSVKIYIYSILVLSKEKLSDHIDNMKAIFARLRATGLKFNAHNYSFGLKMLESVGILSIQNFFD